MLLEMLINLVMYPLEYIYHLLVGLSLVGRDWQLQSKTDGIQSISCNTEELKNYLK